MALTDTAARLARPGYAARGVVYTLVGGLALAAAFEGRGQTEGADGALAPVVGAPFGRALLDVVALGLAAYGVFQFAQARYRAIRTV